MAWGWPTPPSFVGGSSGCSRLNPMQWWGICFLVTVFILFIVYNWTILTNHFTMVVSAYGGLYGGSLHSQQQPSSLWSNEAVFLPAHITDTDITAASSTSSSADASASMTNTNNNNGWSHCGSAVLQIWSELDAIAAPYLKHPYNEPYSCGLYSDHEHAQFLAHLAYSHFNWTYAMLSPPPAPPPLADLSSAASAAATTTTIPVPMSVTDVPVIVETGFGGGHAAALILTCHPWAVVYTFDYFDRRYQREQIKHLQARFAITGTGTGTGTGAGGKGANGGRCAAAAAAAVTDALMSATGGIGSRLVPITGDTKVSVPRFVSEFQTVSKGIRHSPQRARSAAASAARTLWLVYASSGNQRELPNVRSFQAISDCTTLVMSAGFSGADSEIEHGFIRPATTAITQTTTTGPEAQQSAFPLLSDLKCYRNLPYLTRVDAACRSSGLRVYQSFCVGRYLHPSFCR